MNLSVLGFTWLIIESNYLISIASMGLLIVIQIVSLIQYAEQINVLFGRFLNSIRYDDYVQTYSPKGMGKSFDNLVKEFNTVLFKFQEIRAEKEAQYLYLKTIVEHIVIGLIVFDDKGNIHLINNATQALLKIGTLTHIGQLQEVHQPLLDYMQKINSEEKELIKINQTDDILHLAVRKATIKLRNEYFYIVSIQDIQSELEDKEMEAWQNLIRVLTHEIINSVTPIASLASTINGEVEYIMQEFLNKENTSTLLLDSPVANSLEDVHQAIKAIHRRSEGLITFVKDFRSLTKVPLPNLQPVRVESLFHTLQTLLKEELKKLHIQFSFSLENPHLQINIDIDQIEQVLINLIKNGTQAIQEKQSQSDNDAAYQGKIQLLAYKDAAENIIIQIKDNGMGISETALKSIFIPFFTTKKTGSGIGLSLSKQIMRLHGGSIYVNSVFKEETIFNLKFS